MRRFLAVFMLVAVSCCNLYAQKVTYYSGKSNNPDQIMRHHEALTMALFSYIKEQSMETWANWTGAEQTMYSHAQNTCRLELAESKIKDGYEWLTIAVGKGPTMDYTYDSEFVETTDFYKMDETIQIVCHKESGADNGKTIHKYTVSLFHDNNNPKNTKETFTYMCDLRYDGE